MLDEIEKSLNIPDKLFFSIKEVSKILELNASVLRYWEKEFNIIQPKRNQFGHRQYRRNDVILLGLIRELLYSKKFSIQGAKQEIKDIFSNQRKSTVKEKVKDTPATPEKLSPEFDSIINHIISSVEELIRDIEVAVQ